MKFEVIMDVRENPRKCTVEPLRGRANLTILKPKNPVTLLSPILLHIDGCDISEFSGRKDIQSIAVLDSIWKRVDAVLAKVNKPLPQAITLPNSFLTAYPRKNKLGNDPSQGLATIEAMFIAAAFCGDWDETLLDKYHFRDSFLLLNQENWKKYKLGPYAV